MKAMILAAGFGTRLFPLTIDRTKPAIPFLGKPLVGYVAEYLSGFGLKEIIVNVHHQPDSVVSALGDGSKFGVRIEYSREEPSILGTAGALDNVRALLESETFLVINGKIITDIDLSLAIAHHRRTNALATMVLLPNLKKERFTIVNCDDGRVVGFDGFPDPASNGNEPPLMFTGIQILEPAVLDYIPRGVYSDIVPAVYKPAIADGKRISAFVAAGRWYELSTIERYLEVSLAKLAPRSSFVGKGCTIAETAEIESSILWDDVIVGDRSRIYRSVIADGVNIPARFVYRDVAIVRAEMLDRAAEVPLKAPKGYIDGENYVVPLKFD
ncbi:MAG: hypothetical protein C4325_00850 [Blastocatellia bacterium]